MRQSEQEIADSLTEQGSFPKAQAVVLIRSRHAFIGAGNAFTARWLSTTLLSDSLRL